MVIGETLDELAAIAGIGAQVAGITARAMNGEIDFAAALRERVALLYGLPASVLEQVLPRVALTAGARTLLRTMHGHGAYAVLVSGGFSFFTRHVRALCGFDEDVANELEIRDGRLTGRVIEPIRGRAAKRDTLIATAARLNCPPELTLAVGDGANDLDMLMTAGLGIAFHAKPAVASAARARVTHGDLTALLYAQGYRKTEFVE
jgi:phosphoserine phosphatase